jgi:hypothetical protein
MHGEPDAWKLARPVREEGWKNLSLKGDVALHLYFHSQCSWETLGAEKNRARLSAQASSQA